MREIRRRNIRSALVASFVLAVLAVVIGILVDPGLFGRAISHKDWFVHVAPETLVEYSEHIVIARYQDEAVHETPNSSLYPDAPTSFIDVSRWSRSLHPDDRATSVWQTPPGLEVALLDAQGRLSFQVNSYYRAALKDLGFQTGSRVRRPV